MNQAPVHALEINIYWKIKMNEFQHLFQSIKVNKTTLRNRIVAAPVEGIGITKNDDVARYASLAKGGSSIVTVGSVAIDNERSQFITRLVYLGKADAFYLSETAYAINQYGAIPSIELLHAGQWGKYFPGKKYGPVDLVRGDGEIVEAMTEDQMKHVIENYAKAAAFAKQIGFGMVMLHFAHGWLPAQFLSPFYNRRTDQYGGSFENRIRFPSMIVDEVRNAVGKDFPIEMRISGCEYVEGGLEISDVVRFVSIVEEKIDLVHISAGMDKIASSQIKMLPTVYSPHAPNIELSAAVKSKANIPVITVGGINDPYTAEKIIADGKADIVALGRALIADPQFPNKAKEGKSNEITPCIRCTSCFTDYVVKKNVCCTVNPRFSRELRLDYEYRAVPTPKNVVVIGGGPAGMRAAIAAADRGHQVTLIEKSNRLGGMLQFADHSTLRSDLKKFKDFLIENVEKSVSAILLDTAVSKAFLKAIDPDVLIIAIGAELKKPDIHGIENGNVFSVVDMYAHPEKIGKKVAIIGGGQIGCEAGLHLVGTGREVIIIEKKDNIASNANYINRLALLSEISEQERLNICTNTSCIDIQPEKIRIKTLNGSENNIKVDSIVYAVGFQSRTDVSPDLSAFVDKTVFIGDCVKTRGIKDAIREGYHTGMQI